MVIDDAAIQQGMLWVINAMFIVVSCLTAWFVKRLETDVNRMGGNLRGVEKDFSAFKTSVAEFYIQKSDLDRALKPLHDNMNELQRTVSVVEGDIKTLLHRVK